MRKQSIAIVGAGVSGLACAYGLQEKGVAAEIFEKESVPGGRMFTYRKGGHSCSTGAHVFTTSYRAFLELCRKLNIDHLLIPCNCIPKIYFDQRFHFIRLDRAHPLRYGIFSSLEFLSTFEQFRVEFVLKLLGFLYCKKFRGEDFFQPLKPEHPWNYLGAAEILSRWIPSHVLDLVIDPFLNGLSLLSLHWMTMAEFLEILQMCMHDHQCLYFTEGVNFFCETLAKHLPIQYGTTVESLERLEKGAKLIVHGKEHFFDQAVLAIDPVASKKIYRNPTPDQKDLLENARYVSTISVSFIIPLSFFTENSIAVFPKQTSRLIVSYSCVQGLVQSNKTGQKRGVIGMILHEEEAIRLCPQSDEQIYQVVRKELFQLFPNLKDISNEVENFHIHRWNCAMPIHHGKDYRRIKAYELASKTKQTVHLCGDFFSPWIEGSIRSGLRIVDSLIF